MALWLVVGGADKEGIIVREGQDLDSPVLPERLCTGAVVKELELVDGRLRYELLWLTPRERKQAHFCFLAGRVGERIFGPAPEVPVTAPATGWVSTQFHGRNLLVPYLEPECHKGQPSVEQSRDWGSDGSEGFAITVNMLSGQALHISGLYPDMPLAVLGERVVKELGIMEGQELQLILGTRLFTAEDHCRTLEELGLDGQAPLSCVQRTVLQPGDVVVVDGLTSALELNGVTGACERWIPERGRWRVQLSMTKSVKRSDVHVLPSTKVLQPGVDIQLRHDYVVEELAGVEGVCERWVRSDLMEVRLVLSRTIKPQHLHLVSHELAPEVAATMLPDLDAWEERDAQPTAGLNAALGSAFTTRGHPSCAPFAASGVALSDEGETLELSQRRSCGEELHGTGRDAGPEHREQWAC